MKKSIFVLFILFVTLPVYSQNTCTKEQIQKAKLFSQNIISESLESEIERGKYGDCVHHQWMDKMKTVGVKTAIAVVSFSYKGETKKFDVKEINFSENYDFYPTKNGKLLESAKKNGLREDLQEAFITRAEMLLSFIIPNAGRILKNDDSDTIKVKIYLHLFDDEVLPLIHTTSDTLID